MFSRKAAKQFLRSREVEITLINELGKFIYQNSQSLDSEAAALRDLLERVAKLFYGQPISQAIDYILTVTHAGRDTLSELEYTNYSFEEEEFLTPYPLMTPRLILMIHNYNPEEWILSHRKEHPDEGEEKYVQYDLTDTSPIMISPSDAFHAIKRT
jgi:hypothetical protein